MDELLYQNATEDVAQDAGNSRYSAPPEQKWPEQVWRKMDNFERLELEQLRATAPPFGRRSHVETTGFGRRAGVALALSPSQRAQMRHKQVQLTAFTKR